MSFDLALQVKLMDWMRGQSCGLCGQADGETRQEFRTPSRRLTQNAVSHAFSWVLPARSCRENTGEKHSHTVNCFKPGLTHNDKPESPSAADPATSLSYRVPLEA